MNRNLSRYTPLTGVAFVVLVLVGFFSSGDTPDADDSGEEVIEFFSDKEAQNYISTGLITLGAVFLVFFASYLRTMFRDAGGSDQTTAVVFAGGIISAAGFMVDSAIHFALTDSAEDLDPAAAQSLNALWSGFFVPFAFGLSTLLLAAGFAILKTRVLPVWLAYLAFLIFLVSFTPVGFIGFGLAGLWVLIVSILVTVRPRTPRTPQATPAPAPAAPA